MKTLSKIIGKQTYDVWVQMLKTLVPDGRTHRLAPIVAGMLQYALKDVKTTELTKIKEIDDIKCAMQILLPLTIQLFKDAKVKYIRIDRHGKKYSIAESAVHEFLYWYNYPWEDDW